MLGLSRSAKIWLALHPVDMRKSFDGLQGLVIGGLNVDPYCGDIFVFFNRRRTHVKLMVWDGNGFLIHYKRLDEGTFEDLRADHAGNAIRIERAKLMMLLEGIDVKKSKYRRHYARSLRMNGSDGRRQESPSRAAG